jgi:NDP-sugar pyrophosphorylase family protein
MMSSSQNRSMLDPRNMPDALVLCGGAGLRLRTVTGNDPKSMAGVAGRPFLELLLNQLRRHGFNRVILAVGYRREAIEQHFGERAFDMEVVYSREETPLGTGGAIRNALDRIESDEVVVMNGDSYTDADLGQLVAGHRSAGADASIVIFPVDRRNDVGYLQVDQHGHLVGFEEKQSIGGSAYANAGIYVLTRTLLESVVEGQPKSLEKDLFPVWIAQGKKILTQVHAAGCVDIGTPERYEQAQLSLAEVESGVQVQGEAN